MTTTATPPDVLWSCSNSIVSTAHLYLRGKRPHSTSHPSRNPSQPHGITAVGHNTLSQTVKRLCQEAGIQGFKTNHSLRVTKVTRLFQSGADEQLIMSRTGHCSVQGVRTYKRVSEDQKLVLSSVLNAATNGNMEKIETSDCQPQKKPKLDVSTACKSSTITIDTTSAPSTSTLNLENIPTFHFNGCSSITVNITK